MKFKISPFFILYIISLYFIFKIEVMLSILITLLFHELAHIFMIKKLGYKILELNIMPYGGVLNTDKKNNIKISDDILIYFSGPMINLLLFISLYFLDLKFYAYVNLAFFILNIMPIYPLDGYFIVLNLLSIKIPYYFSLKISNIISFSLNIIVSIFLIIYKVGVYYYFISLVLIFKNILLFKKNMIFHIMLKEKIVDYNYLLKPKELYYVTNIKKSIYKGKNIYLNIDGTILLEPIILEKLIDYDYNISK